ncbi:hypothetical protein [Alloactinosynnema sp. L-07]|nr:hypothetical protein [Alloactinosynnema sp. L-07]
MARLHYPNTVDLHHLLATVYEAFVDADREHTTRIVLSMAVESNPCGSGRAANVDSILGD